MRKIDVNPGFNFEFIKSLYSEVESIASCGKLCTWVFNEISSKEEVNYHLRKDGLERWKDFGMFRKGQNIANFAIIFKL